MASDLNKTCLLGRVVKQPDLEIKGNGISLLTFTLAVNRNHKNKDGEYEDKVSFFDFTVFGKEAESLQKHLVKGTVVSIEGHLEQERWEKNGKKFSKVKIVPDSINPFVERKSKEQRDAEENYEDYSNELADFC